MSQAGGIIAHQSVVVRKGLKAVLEEGRWLHVIGEAGDLAQLRTLLQTMTPTFILASPDILDATAYAALLREHDPTFGEASLVALISGEEQVPVHFREHIIPQSSTEELQARLKGILQPEAGQDEDLDDRLSEREVNVLREIVIGQTNKEVGDKLFISPHTVITHRKNITRKIGIRTLSGLTVYAIMNGIVSMEDIRSAEHNAREHEK